MKKLLSLVALTALMSAPIVSASCCGTKTETEVVKKRSCGSCNTCHTCENRECGSCNTCRRCGDREEGTVKGRRYAKHKTTTKHRVARTHKTRTHKKGSYKA